jgi:hypothetical protein
LAPSAGRQASRALQECPLADIGEFRPPLRREQGFARVAIVFCHLNFSQRLAIQ